MNTRNVVLQACLILASACASMLREVHAEQGDLPRTVTMEFNNGQITTFISVDQIPPLIDQNLIDQIALLKRDGEFRPTFTSRDGTHQFVLSTHKPTTPDVHSEFELPAIVKARHDETIRSVLSEIHEHCEPTLEQEKKLEAAASVELARLSRRMKGLINRSAIANTNELSALANELSELNKELAKGPLRLSALTRSIIRTVLSEEQQSSLRWAYMQPLVKILENHHVLALAEQRASLRRLVLSSTIDPLELRNNYGQQFKLCTQFGDERLLQFLTSDQLSSLHLLGKSEFRITLSLATQ